MLENLLGSAVLITHSSLVRAWYCVVGNTICSQLQQNAPQAVLPIVECLFDSARSVLAQADAMTLSTVVLLQHVVKGAGKERKRPLHVVGMVRRQETVDVCNYIVGAPVQHHIRGSILFGMDCLSFCTSGLTDNNSFQSMRA